jgi:FkbM family methyltransferase
MGYSQWVEDDITLALFGDHPDGVYIDVGAFDGITLSNTYCLDQLGWHGICIEADPQTYETLVANRPRAHCIHAAAVGDPKQHTVAYHRDDKVLHSGVKPNLTGMADFYRQQGWEWTGWQTLEVPAITLAKALTQHPLEHVDMLSVDTEGTELDILQAFPFKKHTPRLIIVEMNDERGVDTYLQSQGYFIARWVHVNGIYVRTPEDAARVNAARRDFVSRPV